jgi:pimeloyl-ACP methyl ester carboxylesterase
MLLDWARLAGVLARARDGRVDDDPRCHVDKDGRAANGWSVDHFQPQRPNGGSLLLIHGWTLQGKEDHRLQSFARSLAIAGVRCVVPRVPGLADMRWIRSDVDGLRALLAEETVPIGVVGFSFGGTYGLLAASGSPRVRLVASVSGCSDVAALFPHWEKWGQMPPADQIARESWLYQKLVLAWQRRERLEPAVQAELREHLLAFCHSGGKTAAWAFYERSLSQTNWEAEARDHQDPADLQALSLTAHPPRLTCPVAVLHDKIDPSVPATEADLVVQAIRRGSPTAHVEVMVTDLLRHVSANLAWRPGEILRLLRLLSPLVS